MVRRRRGRRFVSGLELLGFRSDSREPYHPDLTTKVIFLRNLTTPNPGMAPQTIRTDSTNVQVVNLVPRAMPVRGLGLALALGKRNRSA